jgi:hypothetical protein
MPRPPHSPGPGFTGSASENEVEDEIALLFASQLPRMDEFFADPILQTRIGALITRAMNKPMGPRRTHKPR